MSHSSHGGIPRTKPKPSFGWKRAWRITVSVCVVVGTVFFGAIAGVLVTGLINDSSTKTILGIPIKWGLEGIGLAYMIKSAESLLKLAKTFSSYLVHPQNEVSLYPDCVSLAGIVAFVTTTALVPLHPAEAVDEKSPEVIFLRRVDPEGNRPILTFRFWFPDFASAHELPRGATLDSAQVTDLGRITKWLQACVGTKAGEDVVVEVRGYADPNPFESNTVELNRQAAHRRGRALDSALAQLAGSTIGPARFVIRPFTGWPEGDSSAMRRDGEYYNTQTVRVTGRERDQGVFNRRADLLVHKLGTCERLQ